MALGRRQRLTDGVEQAVPGRVPAPGRRATAGHEHARGIGPGLGHAARPRLR